MRQCHSFLTPLRPLTPLLSPIAKSASRFEQAAAIVWPGRRQQQQCCNITPINLAHSMAIVSTALAPGR